MPREPASLVEERILVVDDSVDAAEFVAEVARAMGCQVQVAVEWSQFQTLYDLFDPAVIVLDLVMPGVDGVEILGLLGSRAATASIILFSGTDPQTIDSARRLAESQNLRIVGSLSKPADLAQLRALLRTALETSEPGAAPRASPQARSNAHGTATAVDVRRAIFAGEIVPYYQPKVRLRPRPRIDAVETLARWRHPELGLLGPEEFIPIVERDVELSTEMTLRLLETALGDLVTKPGMSHLRLSLNMPVASIDNRSLPDRLATMLRVSSCEPSRLTIEVTEHARISEHWDAAEVLTRFRLKGFGLSMDDFGTGYSTLAQLVRLPFNELKVDRRFVAEIGRHRQSELIIESTVAMAHRLGMEVCAEGIETPEALRFVHDAGCDSIQGFLVSEPLPADRVAGFLAGWVGLPI